MKEYKDDKYIYDALDSIDLDDLNGVYEEEVKGDSEVIKLKVMDKITKGNNISSKPKKSRFYKWRKAIVAALVLIVVTGSVMGGGISRANRLNENTSIEAYGMDVNKEALEKYSTDVNKVVTDKDVNLKIKNVLIDGNAIWIDYDVYSDKYNFKEDTWPREMDNLSQLKMKLNGKEIATGGSGSGGIVDKNTFTYTQIIDLKDFDFKGKVNVEIFANEIGNEKGNWKLNFEIDSKDIVNETKEYKVRKFVKLDNVLVRIKSVVINPIQTTVYYSSFGKIDSVLSLLDVLNEDNEALGFTGGEENGKFFIKNGKATYSSAKVKGDSLTLVFQKKKVLKTGETVKDGKPKEVKVKLNK